MRLQVLRIDTDTTEQIVHTQIRLLPEKAVWSSYILFAIPHACSEPITVR